MIDNRVPVNSPTTSPTLLAGVRAHEPKAWERFLSLYQPLVLYWCQREGLQAADAEDVAQDVFAAAAGAINRFRHDRPEDTLRGWLRKITGNKAHDHRQRAGRQPAAIGGSDAQREMLAVPGPPGPDEEADTTEQRIVLRQAVEMILSGYKDHTRQAFWRVVVDRRKPEDVALELGIKVHSVYLAKSRVLQRLRDEFAGLVNPNWGTEPGSEPEDAS